MLKLSDEQNIEVRNIAMSCLALIKLRLRDHFIEKDLLNGISENKKIKIEEYTKSVTYDPSYDIEVTVDTTVKPENTDPIKINRKNYSVQVNSDLKANINNKVKEDPIINETKILLDETNQDDTIKIKNTDVKKIENVEPYSKNQKQVDLEEFEKKLEEAMKKESERKDNINEKTVDRKPLIINKKSQSTDMKSLLNNNNQNNEDEEDSKLNKDDIENKFNSLIGEEGANLLLSSKWDEKKNGFIILNKWLETVDNIQTDQLITYVKIKLKDYKESNFNIIREAVNVYITLISNFTGKGFDKKLCANIIKGLFEKLSDAKLKDNISNLLFVMMENIGPKFIITTLLKYLNNEKKPATNPTLKEYAILFQKVIEEFGISLTPIKDLVEYCKNLASNTNPQVRNSATSLLCVLYKYVGKDIKTLLKDIKESTLKVIESELDKVKIETGEFIRKRELKQTALKEEGLLPSIDTTKANKTTSQFKVNLIDSLIPRVDISKKITSKLLKEINDGKWPEKKKACDTIEEILNEANMKILPNGLADLFACFKSKLGDGNNNLVRLLISLLSKIIDSLGPGFKQYTKTVSTALINNLSDKMQMLREDTLNCLDKWVSHCGLETIMVYLPNFLKQDNFEMRSELLKFLHKHKENFVFVKNDLKDFVSPLLLCLQDKSVSIRNSSEELIAYSLKFIPINSFINGLKDFKPAIINTLKPILEKYRGSTLEDNSELNSYNNSTTSNLKQDLSGDLLKTKTNKDNTNNKTNKPVLNKVENNQTNSITKDKSTSNITQKSNINVIKVGKKIKNQSDNNLIGLVANKNSKNIMSNKSNEELSSNSMTIKKNTKMVNSNSNLSVSPRITMNNKKSKEQNNILSFIFVNNISIKLDKDKRLELDKKYKFNLDNVNEDYATKLKSELKLLFIPEFIDKLFSDDLRINTEALVILYTQMKDDMDVSCNPPFYDYLDLILKWIGLKTNNNHNPMIIKALLEFFELLHDKLIEKEYKLNESEGSIILALLVDKLGTNNAKVKDSAKFLLEKYLTGTVGIDLYKGFTNIISSSASKNPKVKVECLEICTSLLKSIEVNQYLNKDIKFIAKWLTSTDLGLKNAAIGLLAEVYGKIKDNLWNILNDIPEKIKDMLNNKFNPGATTPTSVSLLTENPSAKSLHRESFSQKSVGNNLANNAKNNSKNNIQSSLMGNNSNGNLNPKSDDFLAGGVQLTENNNNNNNNNNNKITKEKENIPNSNINLTLNSLNNKQDLIKILNNLNDGEISDRVNTILIIHELIYTKFNQTKNVLIPNIDIIVKTFIIGLQKLFVNKNLNDIPIKLGKYLLTVLYKISSNKELIKNISYEALFELSEEVLNNLLIENLDKVEKTERAK